MRKFGLKAALAALFATFAAPSFAQPSASPTLDAIKARGTLVCGIHNGVAGFALPDSRGVWQGFDVDLCRGLAVAIFNDASKVRFVPLSSSTRFKANLKSVSTPSNSSFLAINWNSAVKVLLVSVA